MAIPPEGERRVYTGPERRKSGALSGHLELLAEMSGHLAASLDIEDTIQSALKLIAKYVNAEGGALFLLEDNDSKLVCKASVGPVDITGITLNADQGIVGQCVTNDQSKIVRDVSEDPNFQQSIDKETGFTTRSIVCAPMNVHDQKIGAIELVNKSTADNLFSEPDLMMLQTLASAAALAIRNARMAEALVEQERVRRELELAIEIQRSLLPPARPDPFPVFGINLPAREVSGDFYDFFELDDGRIYFSLGDVSGKGMDAALLMSKTASLFRCLGKTIHDPSVLLATINEELYETAIHGKFVTMACGILEPDSGKIRLANAGHEPPLIHNPASGEFVAVPADVPPLGILPMEAGEGGIAESSFDLNGGTLYVFTDGVTEGDLENGSRLEVDGFKEIVLQRAQDPVSTRIEAVVDLLKGNGHSRHDDITILAVQDTRH